MKYHECDKYEETCQNITDYNKLKEYGKKYFDCANIRNKVKELCYSKDKKEYNETDYRHELAYLIRKHISIDCLAKMCDYDNYDNIKKYEHCKHLHESALKINKEISELESTLFRKYNKKFDASRFEIFKEPNTHVKKISENKKKITKLQKEINEQYYKKNFKSCEKIQFWFKNIFLVLVLICICYIVYYLMRKKFFWKR